MQIKLMKTGFLFILFLLNFLFVPAQRVFIGAAGGLSNYNGDLLDKLYHKKLTNGFIGLTVHYELQDQILIRGSYNFARVNGSDIYSEKEDLRMRNLHFESAISEFSIVGEYYLFNLYDRRFSPYGFVGLGVFHFDPYAYDSSGRKVFLKPLSTEGEGIYPDKKPYSLWQPTIPFGGGFKYAITENLRIGFEIGLRKLFTDYLDDVSTNYPDQNDLLAARGQTAVDFSYRGDEVPGGDAAFPTKNTQRGGAKQKDMYYFTGLNIMFRPSFGGSGGSSRSRGFGKKGKYGCPTVPL
ncbi:MAG: hypothetical protein E6H08_03870 [Bacteroidetes bacterium]|nr:MAG: hypothetical protein E6H08_03870 [Bacteroidota bacterium]